MSRSPVLTAQCVSFRYEPRQSFAVRDVDLEVAVGAALGIVGESGSGKTTLGRLLVGSLQPQQGSIMIEGRPWSAVRRKDAVRRRVQMIFQDPHASLNPWISALDAVAEVIVAHRRQRRQAAREQALELLAEVGIRDDTAVRRPRQLSGGQAQRVSIARALAAEPAVLVADEPTSALDLSVQAQILNLLIQIRVDKGLALVLISHDLSVVRLVTDEAIVMYEGCVVEAGATEQLMTAPVHPYTATLVASTPGREIAAETTTTRDEHGSLEAENV